jgi:hypothetical protein
VESATVIDMYDDRWHKAQNPGADGGRGEEGAVPYESLENPRAEDRALVPLQVWRMMTLR